MRRHAGANSLAPGAPTHSYSFSEIEEKDLLKEFAVGRVTEANSSGTLLEKVAKKFSPQTLLEEVKFYFYFSDGHIKVLATGLDQDSDLRGGKKPVNNMFSTQTEGLGGQNEECDYEGED